MKTFPTKTAYVHILIGQSNMARGAYSAATPKTLDSYGRDVSFSDSGKNGTWGVDASAPSSGTGASVAYASTRIDGAYGSNQIYFGRRMSRRIKSGRHHIVKFAINGWELSNFATVNWQNLLDTINAAMATLTSAGYTPVLSSVFFWQGESDGMLTQVVADAYAAKLAAFIAALRSALSAPKLPFAVMQLGTWQTAVTYLTTIRAAQAAVVAADPLCVLTTCEGFTTADNLHGTVQADYEAAVVAAAEALLPLL